MPKIIHLQRKGFERQEVRINKSGSLTNITYYHYAKSRRKAAGSGSILET